MQLRASADRVADPVICSARDMPATDSWLGFGDALSLDLWFEKNPLPDHAILASAMAPHMRVIAAATFNAISSLRAEGMLALRSCELFASKEDWPDRVLEQLSSGCERVTVERYKHVYRACSPAECAYIVIRGSVLVTPLRMEPVELGVGALFGESALMPILSSPTSASGLLKAAAWRPESAECRQGCKLLKIDTSALLAVRIGIRKSKNMTAAREFARAAIRQWCTTLFKNISLFQGCSHRNDVETAALFSPRLCRAGEAVFSKGAPGFSFFVVVSGAVGIVVLGAERCLDKIVRLVAHDDTSPFFGEFALLRVRRRRLQHARPRMRRAPALCACSPDVRALCPLLASRCVCLCRSIVRATTPQPGRPRTASAVAQDDSILLEMPASAYQTLVRFHPTLSEHFIQVRKYIYKPRQGELNQLALAAPSSPDAPCEATQAAARAVERKVGTGGEAVQADQLPAIGPPSPRWRQKQLRSQTRESAPDSALVLHSEQLLDTAGCAQLASPRDFAARTLVLEGGTASRVPTSPMQAAEAAQPIPAGILMAQPTHPLAERSIHSLPSPRRAHAQRPAAVHRHATRSLREVCRTGRTGLRLHAVVLFRAALSRLQDRRAASRQEANRVQVLAVAHNPPATPPRLRRQSAPGAKIGPPSGESGRIAESVAVAKVVYVTPPPLRARPITAADVLRSPAAGQGLSPPATTVAAPPLSQRQSSPRPPRAQRPAVPSAPAATVAHSQLPSNEETQAAVARLGNDLLQLHEGWRLFKRTSGLGSKWAEALQQAAQPLQGAKQTPRAPASGAVRRGHQPAAQGRAT
jgi:CRP-like cAMP-binding protein